MKFSETLSKIIDITGLKLKDISVKTGYDISYISKWSNGKLLPSSKNFQQIFDRLSIVFAEAIWRQTKENKLAEAMKRSGILESESQVRSYIFENLLISFENEAVTELNYKENTFIVVDKDDQCSNIALRILKSLLPKRKLKARMHWTVDYQILMDNFFTMTDRKFFEGDYTIDLSIILKDEEVSKLASEGDIFTILSMMSATQFYNINIFRQSETYDNDFLFVEIEGESPAVIFFKANSEGHIYILSYTKDPRIIEDYRVRVHDTFKSENLLLKSMESLQIEYDNLLSNITQNEPLITFGNYNEGFFISEDLLDEILQKRKFALEDKMAIKRLQKLYQESLKERPLMMFFPLECLHNIVRSREIVLGKWNFELDDEEWKHYKEDLKKKGIENPNVSFYQLTEAALPKTMRNMQLYFFSNGYRGWIKKNPRYQDPHTKQYVNIIERNMTLMIRQQFLSLVQQGYICEIKRDKVAAYIDNYELLYLERD